MTSPDKAKTNSIGEAEVHLVLCQTVSNRFNKHIYLVNLGNMFATCLPKAGLEPRMAHSHWNKATVHLADNAESTLCSRALCFLAVLCAQKNRGYHAASVESAHGSWVIFSLFDGVEIHSMMIVIDTGIVTCFSFAIQRPLKQHVSEVLEFQDWKIDGMCTKDRIQGIRRYIRSWPQWKAFKWVFWNVAMFVPYWIYCLWAKCDASELGRSELQILSGIVCVCNGLLLKSLCLQCRDVLRVNSQAGSKCRLYDHVPSANQSFLNRF